MAPSSITTAGHWEIAAGAATIDLNDQQTEGGTAQRAIIGINGYLSRHVKFQLNLIRVHTNESIFGGTDLTLVAGRGQTEF